MAVAVPHGNWLDIAIRQWDGGNRRLWQEQSITKMDLAHTISGLTPGAAYMVLLDGNLVTGGLSDANGSCSFTFTLEPGRQNTIEVR
jgi:hypothetical protein